jgi:ribosomal protein L37E
MLRAMGDSTLSYGHALQVEALADFSKYSFGTSNAIQEVAPMNYKCQACGFAVFNRRYPKCESCGVELAPGIALSKEERESLFSKDAEDAEAASRGRDAEQRQAEMEKGSTTDFLLTTALTTTLNL